MLKIGLIGLGKMGMSHMAMVNAHPKTSLVAICDTSDYLCGVLEKHAGHKTYSNYKKMLADEDLDAILISTPSKTHASMVRDALDAGLHVFCEKPFVLDPEEGQALSLLADKKGLVNQVGYHYRFVGSFREAKNVIESGAIGDIHNVQAYAYGPVVLKSKGGSWRSHKSEGGGCLYDYACHALDLMEFLVGSPETVAGAVTNSVFSRDVDDEVYAILRYANGTSGLVSANWSDESHRKMSTKITVWGTKGKIVVDRQEIQVYLRDGAGAPEPYKTGWTIRYTTELTKEQWYYLRGEEYSAQIDHFVTNALSGNMNGENSFRSAVATDKIAMQIRDKAANLGMPAGGAPTAALQGRRRGFFGRAQSEK